MQGNLLKIWDSAKSIEKESNGKFDGSSIIKSCKGKYLQCNGYIFIYNKGDIYKEFINHMNTYNENHKKKVIFQLYNNKLIRIWKSVKEMVLELKDTTIYNKLNNNIEILKENVFTYKI